MNEAEFYKGMIVELQKLAVVQPIPPKKHSVWPSIAMDALGAGALGLGAYGLYKGLKPLAGAIPNTTSTDPAPSHTSAQLNEEGSNLFDKAETGSTGAQYTGDGAKVVGEVSGAGIADATEAAGGLMRKLRWLKPLKPLSNIGAGVGSIAEGLNPNSDEGPWSRASQVSGGGALTSAQILDSRLGSTASKILPQAMRSPALEWGSKLIGDAGGTGLRLVPGLGQVYTIGGIGAGAVAATSAAADLHSSRLNDVSNVLGNSYKGLSKNQPNQGFKLFSTQGHNSLPAPQNNSSATYSIPNLLLNDHKLFDTAEGQKLTKQVTNPNIFARMGYGWGGTSPNTESLQKDYDKEKTMYDNIVNSGGFRKPLIQRDLQDYESQVPEAYANSVPVLPTDNTGYQGPSPYEKLKNMFKNFSQEFIPSSVRQ